MARTERTTAAAVFDNRDQAERAVEELRRAGFGDDQIGVAMRDEEGRPEQRRTTEQTDDKTEEGAAGGVVGGGVLGGVLGAAAAGAIPGIGPVLAVGTLAGVLGGAAIGGAAGGIVGALVGQGIPEEEARYYDEEVRSGRTLVTVDTRGRFDEANSILQSAGGHSAMNRGTQTRSTETHRDTDTSRPATGTTYRARDEDRHP